MDLMQKIKKEYYKITLKRRRNGKKIKSIMIEDKKLEKEQLKLLSLINKLQKEKLI